MTASSHDHLCVRLPEQAGGQSYRQLGSLLEVSVRRHFASPHAEANTHQCQRTHARTHTHTHTHSPDSQSSGKFVHAYKGRRINRIRLPFLAFQQTDRQNTLSSVHKRADGRRKFSNTFMPPLSAGTVGPATAGVQNMAPARPDQVESGRVCQLDACRLLSRAEELNVEPRGWLVYSSRVEAVYGAIYEAFYEESRNAKASSTRSASQDSQSAVELPAYGRARLTD
ncbi:unnamed protein product [Protopolystoma xenopodis]|uniref:Uncharacterized protein n=1 Tax=Protopolystoma xenopodis TaxID=117903 RepID=A0A448X0J9_9PLAT|nr:unnamed protein product [Protopolystoma xenopodis]